MTRVDTSLSALTFCVVACLTATLPTFAQSPASPRGSVAVNAPGVPADTSSAKSASAGPQPISPATPRVGPAPAGQVVADDYRIGSSDLLEIQVFGVDTLKRE